MLPVTRIDTVLRCSPAEAFRLWTDSSAIQSWWGDANTYRTVGWVSDLRDGGSWRAEFEAVSGDRFGAGGGYTMVVDPTRLEWTWTPDWDPGVANIIAMTFATHGDGTVMGVSCSGFKDEAEQKAGEQGWREIIGWLEQHIALHEKPTA